MAHAKAMRKGYHDLLRREILELIPDTAKSILDLGCGAGNLGKALKQRQDCRVFGIELNKEAGEIAKKNLDGVWIDNLNRFDPSFSTVKYDCLVFADILEHLINPWTVLKKFVSVLADGGTIIASFPNIAHPWYISNLQQGLFRYEPAGVLDITHLRFFTKTSIFQLFYAAGLKIVNIKPYPSAEHPLQYHVTAVKPEIKHTHPVATILMLAHNGWTYTKQCIDSIKRNTHAPYKILVIDNGSTDETVEELRKDRSIFHIENSFNLGFSKGFNVGLTQIDTQYFILSNSDVIVTPNWLTTMIKHIELDNALMLLGPRSNYVSGPQVVKDVSYTDEASLEAFAKDYSTLTPNPIQYFPRIVFFFTLFKTEALRKVGFLDEIFGKGNYEDDDYCMRTNVKKLKTAYDNTVFIHHYGSVGFKKNVEEYRALMEENEKKFMQKWKFNSMQDYYKYLNT